MVVKQISYGIQNLRADFSELREADDNSLLLMFNQIFMNWNESFPHGPITDRAYVDSLSPLEEKEHYVIEGKIAQVQINKLGHYNCFGLISIDGPENVAKKEQRRLGELIADTLRDFTEDIGVKELMKLGRFELEYSILYPRYNVHPHSDLRILSEHAVETYKDKSLVFYFGEKETARLVKEAQKDPLDRPRKTF
jgi:hypothetical protein